MDQIEMLTEQLLQAILASDIYKDYIEQEEKLEHIPGLKERVNRFRADNFLMQQENPADLYTVSEIMDQRSSELRKVPEANAYLEAELAVNKMMQRICGTLFAGISYSVPDDV